MIIRLFPIVGCFCLFLIKFNFFFCLFLASAVPVVSSPAYSNVTYAVTYDIPRKSDRCVVPPRNNNEAEYIEMRPITPYSPTDEVRTLSGVEPLGENDDPNYTVFNSNRSIMTVVRRTGMVAPPRKYISDLV